MKPKFKENKRIHKDIIYKVLIFIGAVACITYFLPRESKFNYQYELNRPWKYGQLIAPFDIPIYKEDKIIKNEEDSILKSDFRPYYNIDNTVCDSMIRKFELDYTERLHTIIPHKSQKEAIISYLQKAYTQGIISSDSIKQLMDDGIQSIMVTESKSAYEQDISKLYTPKFAYEELTNRSTTTSENILFRQCNLNRYFIPNLFLEAERTQTVRKELLSSLSLTKGLIQSGQKIIDKGEIVDQKAYNILNSLSKETSKHTEAVSHEYMTLAGQVLLVSILMFCFMFYLELFKKDLYHRKRNLTLLFLLIIFYCVITSVINSNSNAVYIIPYAMMPIIIRIFLDSRTAFVAYTTTIIICSIVVSSPQEFIILQIVTGMIAIYSLKELSQRSQLIKSAVIISVGYAVTFFAYEMIMESDITKFNTSRYSEFAINGILLLFTYPFLFLLEKMFGFTSNVTLVELSNINNPLLRRLSEVAPGTFQHSMQMANLASAAALKIGANSQLVRTGALYHDIGKMQNPAFFTENQSGGFNPHSKLSFEQSAKIVINHIYDGIKLADKHNLPNAVKDFIVTHHGEGKTKYFYISWMNEHPGETPDDSKFSYPGPNPFSKETAILMMADSVEAASRSLKEYTEETISNLVEKLIDAQVNEGYFKKCPITFQDIENIKEVFKEKLKIIYHTRISYPELKN